MGFFPPQLVFVIGGIMLMVVTLVVSLGTQQTNTDDGLARPFMSRMFSSIRNTIPRSQELAAAAPCWACRYCEKERRSEPC